MLFSRMKNQNSSSLGVTAQDNTSARSVQSEPPPPLQNDPPPPTPITHMPRRTTSCQEGLRGGAGGNSVPVTTEEAPAEDLTCSITESDLQSNNSHLNASFPSLASSTLLDLAQFDMGPPPLPPPQLSTAVKNSFIGGAGPHCPSPHQRMDSSLVERRSRARVGKMKIVELKVLGRDFGSKVLEALRFVFKSYQPAVALSRESLRGPSWGDDGAVMERFARNLMDSGCVERAEDLSVLSDLLRFTHDILTAVLSKEKELKQYLPLQTQQEFSLNGPVSNIITSQHVTALLRLCASWSR